MDLDRLVKNTRQKRLVLHQKKNGLRDEDGCGGERLDTETENLRRNEPEVQTFDFSKQQQQRKIGLEILLISDRSLLGTNNTGGDDDDDFAKDGKKNEETESESDEEEDESGSDVSSSKDDSEDEREEGAKEGLKTAACAVEVSVGYLSDPENFHGLSHFRTHGVPWERGRTGRKISSTNG